MNTTIGHKVSVKELAQALRKTTGTIRRLAREGKLPGAKLVGGTWYFDIERINNYFSR